MHPGDEPQPAADACAAHPLLGAPKARRRGGREAQQRNKVERHAEVDRLKSVPCTDCGKAYPPYVMDFDHRDPSIKGAEINHLLNKTTAPWARVLEEIAKCDVVCVNCHRLRTGGGASPDARKRLLRSLKRAPCLDCGQRFEPCQMDFDHVRGEKIREVSRMTTRALILAEAAKCDIVCANCHRARTQVQAKGAARLNPGDVDMVWQRRSPKGLQTILAPAAPPQVVPAFRPWHALAGTLKDRDLAAQFGVSCASVSMYRKRAGVPRYRSVSSAVETHEHG